MTVFIVSILLIFLSALIALVSKYKILAIIFSALLLVALFSRLGSMRVLEENVMEEQESFESSETSFT
ncbi:MAG: hypothetical protein GX221_00355 [Candidatus Riflebacteria bacterium]|nr:hypothetical protein [Candidatus Riflebacteria bacterium]